MHIAQPFGIKAICITMPLKMHINQTIETSIFAAHYAPASSLFTIKALNKPGLGRIENDAERIHSFVLQHHLHI